MSDAALSSRDPVSRGGVFGSAGLRPHHRVHAFAILESCAARCIESTEAVLYLAHIPEFKIFLIVLRCRTVRIREKYFMPFKSFH